MKKMIISIVLFSFFDLKAAYQVYICHFDKVMYEVNHEQQSKELGNDYKSSFLMYYSDQDQWFYNQAKEEIPNFEDWNKENKYSYKKKDNNISSLLRQFRSNLELNIDSKKKNIPHNFDYNSKYELNLTTNKITLTNKTLFKYEYYEKLFNTVYTGKCKTR
jgi:hypothetical protein